MRGQRGASLLELLAVLMVIGIAASAAVAGSLSWIHRQAARSAVFHVQAMFQTARAEAVARNNACRVRVDTVDRSLRIVDLNLPGSGDDQSLSELRLSRTTRFDRPDGGNAVTLPELEPGIFEATFEADGTVSSGAGGEIVLAGGDAHHRVTLFGAGAVRVERWEGGAWSGS